MSKLSDLIQELCPNGVEYKKIKNVYKRLKGTPITAQQMKNISDEDGDIHIFAGGKTKVTAREESIPNSNITRVPAVLVQSRGLIDVVYCDTPFTFKNEMWAYTAEKEVSVKFLYYILKNNINYFRDAAAQKGSLPQISLWVTEDFEIPVPPLPVQREIVRILDTFTELTKELTLRKKQYEYYRDRLLTFDEAHPLRSMLNELCPNGVEYKKIGEFTRILRGKRLTKNVLSAKGKFPVFHGGIEPLGYYGESNRVANTVMVINVGASAGTVGYSKTDFWSSDGCYCLERIHGIDDRFIYFSLLHQEKTIQSKVRRAGIPTLDTSAILNLHISIPPLAVQREIVRILDKFEALCHDLTAGLPAEIAARQKQYEYYRDKLLSFRPMEENA